MVKIVRSSGSGAEVVTVRDLVAPAGPVAPIVGATGGNPLQSATQAVEQMDKWISLADRGVSLFGRIDSILGRVQSLRGAPPAQQQQGPPRHQVIAAPPVDMPVNAERPAGDPGPVPQAQLPRPAVDVREIIQALDMIAKMTPGITVEQLAQSMAARPDECQRILDAAIGKKAVVGNAVEES